MKILSIDIGIKNLAYVILESSSEKSNSLTNNKDYNKDYNNLEFKILDWNIINLCNTIPNCSFDTCKCKAKYSKHNKFYCKKHTKNEEFKIPTLNVKNLHKQSLKNLQIIANEYCLIFDKSTNKSNITKLIEDYLQNSCFDVIETKNANNVNLVDLGINLKLECNKIFQDIESFDQIILENQISPIANRMKTLQGMIAQYFIDHGNYNISFMSAINKLKLLEHFRKDKTSKMTYNERKKLSILCTSEILNSKNMANDFDFFNKHNKKDDLSDCLLQGLYYLL